MRLVPDREPLRQIRPHRSRSSTSDGTFVNAELIKNGYAATIEIEPNTSKAELVRGAGACSNPHKERTLGGLRPLG